jgi:dienelactone hydrolase
VRTGVVAVVVAAVIVAGLGASPAARRRASCSPGPISGTAVADPTAGVTRFDVTLAYRVAGKCRVLVTQVRIPAGTTTPLPLLLVVHGADGNPNRLGPLLDAWTGAGYVVAAPTFPGTKKRPNGRALPSEVARQAADARFVIGELLDRSDGAAGPNPLLGVVDDHEIGVAGMSLGGMTVYGLISHTCCRDGRLQAALVMAGVHDDFPDGKYVHQNMPVLLIQGDADIGYHHSRDTYPQLAPPKWFITLHGKYHSPPFEVPRGKSALIVDTTTVAFWNRYLKHRRAAAQEIVDIVRATKGTATLQRDLSVR